MVYPHFAYIKGKISCVLIQTQTQSCGTNSDASFLYTENIQFDSVPEIWSDCDVACSFPATFMQISGEQIKLGYYLFLSFTFSTKMKLQCIFLATDKVKVNQSRYRPGVAQRVAGS